MQRINTFLLALLIFACIVIVVQIVSPYGSYQNQRQPQESENSNIQHRVPDHASIPKPSIQIDCDPNCTAKESEEHRNENWAARFVRKSLDDPLAAFTGILALATMFLALYTATVARATKAAAEHIPRVERAYIYGGFGPAHRRLCECGQFIMANVSMANYGKTPGFLRYIEVGAGLARNLPPEPNYARTVFVISDLYFPQMTIEKVRYTKAWASVPADGNHAVFQRVHYTDFLGRKRFSGSVYRLFISPGTTNHIGDQAIEPDSAYWSTDEDQPKK